MKRMAMAVGLAGAMLLGGTVVNAAEQEHRIGGGAHYWRTIDSIDLDNVDDDGVSYYGSYQYRPGLVGFETDVEWFENGFGGAAKDVYAPQAYVVVGDTIYAAAGAGWYYSDNEFSSKPFYAFRAGFDLEVLPAVFLDINANYRFENWDDLHTHDKNIDTDTVSLGAAVRIAL